MRTVEIFRDQTFLTRNEKTVKMTSVMDCFSVELHFVVFLPLLFRYRYGNITGILRARRAMEFVPKNGDKAVRQQRGSVKILVQNYDMVSELVPIITSLCSNSINKQGKYW